MPSYAAPVRDQRFIIDEVLGLSAETGLPNAGEATPDIVQAILEEAGKFAAEVIAPLNAAGDREGCARSGDGSVRTPGGFPEAFTAFSEAGWGTISAPVEYGGQGMPRVLSVAIQELMSSANMAFAMYPGLTNGAIEALLAVGSDELKQRYVPSMVSGKWTGTMNLTEPQCGTDLGLIRTRAEPGADGSYVITGTKIFISAGEHDMAANIVHLVLARTPDAPAGTKGISLFVVPKFLVNTDGSLGERNAVSCGALEHKMGIHANATCVMNYDGATGWMVGEENKGLAAMFIMMNAARLGVGVQGLAVAEVAYQNGVSYARERRQGRALAGAADPSEKADLLIVHPDVRRMLMEARAFIEGMRGLALWGGLLVELADNGDETADDLIGLLTPVIKGYGTDMGYKVATDMQQIWGGHGYITDNGMEQFVRDARIAMIYEGANGVQAMDLVGRKLARNGGRAIQAFFSLVDQECAEGKTHERLAHVAVRIEKANAELKAATMWFMQNAMMKPDNAGAGAYAYMHMLGIVALGLMWLRMGKAALRWGAGEGGDREFIEAKLVTATFFAERFTPLVGALRRQIESGSDTTMALPAHAF